MSIGHLYAFFREVSIWVLCPLFNWIVWFLCCHYLLASAVTCLWSLWAFQLFLSFLVFWTFTVMCIIASLLSLIVLNARGPFQYNSWLSVWGNSLIVSPVHYLTLLEFPSSEMLKLWNWPYNFIVLFLLFSSLCLLFYSLGDFFNFFLHPFYWILNFVYPIFFLNFIVVQVWFSAFSPAPAQLPAFPTSLLFPAPPPLLSTCPL